MRLLGSHFVLGQTIEEALSRAGSHREFRYSFDMLGEGARTAADAERYFGAYAEAIDAIGARAGNASLEEIVMALRTRGDYFKDFRTNIKTKKIYPLSRMVAAMTGLQVQRNKAIVGENAFAHEAGIHQDGVLKERSTYEIMDPTDVGLPRNKLVLGKHSGRHAFRERVTELGYTLNDEQVEKAFTAFKALADKKKDVYDEDLEAILDQQLQSERRLWELVRFQVTSGTGIIATATVELRDASGHQVMDAATGDGPIDAVYSAIQRLTGVSVVLQEYRTRAITGGKDAQGEVCVTVRHHDRTVRGRGLSTDVIEAAARAYLAAINRIKAGNDKPSPPDSDPNQPPDPGSAPAQDPPDDSSLPDRPVATGTV
jgi:2-isopropylmalate synthase